jgi:hypothetical protein
MRRNGVLVVGTNTITHTKEYLRTTYVIVIVGGELV